MHLLVVDDDEVDVQGLRRAFSRSRIANPITVARDGLEALAILRGTDGHAPLPRPHIVLLDLNMPRMNGFEFLKALRDDPVLRPTVVFMITTSKDEEDKARAYGHNVAGYIVKQDPAHTFMEAVALLDNYWKIVDLPV